MNAKDTLNEKEYKYGIKREYTFGRNDASLIITGDNSFFVVNHLMATTSQYNTYNEAAGAARMISARNKTW